MTRLFLGLAVLALLAGCAAQPVPPETPPLQCPDPVDRPVDGGLGGTGNAPPEECGPPAS